MELSLKTSETNHYPLQALLIRGATIDIWLREMQYMNLSLKNLKIYALPDLELNSIYGCLLIFQEQVKIKDTRSNIWCQKLGEYFFISQYCDVYPKISREEIDKLFTQPHFLHPSLGLIELECIVDYSTYLTNIDVAEIKQSKPQEKIFIPSNILSFRVSVVPQDDLAQLLENIEDKADIDKLKSEPLSTTEKIRLQLYKKLMNGLETKEIDSENIPRTLKMVQSIATMFNKKDNSKNWVDDKLKDYEQLANRNKDQLDQLLELLKNDPEKALDYAIPLDEEGTSRGEDLGVMTLNKQSNNLSSLHAILSRNSNQNSGGGHYTLEDEALKSLRKQYRDSAEQLIKEKKYLKASYVYIKLLKDNSAAANMFEDAKLYKESGDVYFKLIKNSAKAGELYERGKLYKDAIKVYETLNWYEKIGDLYAKLDDRNEAYKYYQKEVDSYVGSLRYLEAAEIHSSKMNQLDQAQILLMEGWKKKAGSHNCLEKYLSNIEDESYKCKEIKKVYKEDIDGQSATKFLSILKKEYNESDGDKLRALTKSIAYQIIADIIPKNKQIANEMMAFNKGDNQLIKDTIRYKTSRK